MSDKKNDEKLRILQERLAQIKGKQDTKLIQSNQKKIATQEYKAPFKEDKALNLSWIKYLVIGILFIGVLVFGVIYTYTNIDSSYYRIKFSEIFLDSSLEEESEVITSTKLEYHLNSLDGDNIAIIKSFEDESSAKAKAIDLKVKGFKSDYFFLPNKSNSDKKVYQVYIGPYENEEETNQWIENINQEVTIVNIIDGRIIEKIKSKTLIAKEKAEKKKIDENNKKIKLAKLKREEKEKYEQEKIDMKNKIEQEKIDNKEKQEAEQEKIDNNEKAELARIENKEKLDFELKKKIFENEKKQLQIDRERLREDEESLLIKKQQANKKITIKYTYNFKTTIENEGILIIKNNANYPVIKEKFANIKSQGGIEKIISDEKYYLNTYGENIDGIYFEKSGTIVPIYTGSIIEVKI